MSLFFIFWPVFMHYSLHPHIYFMHPTYILCTPPICDSLAPLCLCFSFLGLCLCINRCTLTFTSRGPYVFVSHFWACVLCLLHAPHTLLMHPIIAILFFTFIFFVINFFSIKEKMKIFWIIKNYKKIEKI